MKKIITVSLLLAALAGMAVSCNETPGTTPPVKTEAPVTIPPKTADIKSEKLENGLEYIPVSDIAARIVGIGDFKGEELVIPAQDKDGRVIESIEEYAFKNCTQIKSVSFEGNLGEIKAGAFQGCTALERIVFPASLRKIGTFAFYGCESLKSLGITENVALIGQNALANCKALREISVVEENDVYKSENGVLYTKDMKSLIAYPIGNTAESFTLPEGVEHINNAAFEYCDNIKVFNASETMKEIDDHAFRYCKNLKEIHLTEAFKRMGVGSFYGCSALDKIYYSGSKDMWEEKGDDDEEFVQLSNTWKTSAGKCEIVYGK